MIRMIPLFAFILIVTSSATSQEMAKTAVEGLVVANPEVGNGTAVMQAGDYRIVGSLGQQVAGNLGQGAGALNPVFWHLVTQKNSSAPNSADSEIPKEFFLHRNYPNPFNPATTIRIELPAASHVVLKVYDLRGREVAVLVDRILDAGEHEASFRPDVLASGVYFYRIQTERFTRTKKLMFLK